MSRTGLGKRVETAEPRHSVVEDDQSPECVGCGTATEQLFRCTGCEATRYCSKDCQRRNWAKHKTLCQSVQVLALQQRREITDACEVANRTGKHKAIAKLIGKKTEVKCWIDGLAVSVLWDTGAQVSIINQTWLETHLKDVEVRPVSELLEGVEIEGVGKNTIPYSGYVLLEVEMTKGNKLKVPFLVTSVKLRQPLIGTNVMEEVVSTYGESQLWPALQQTEGIEVSAVSAELMTEQQPLSMVKTMCQRPEDMTIKAGQVGVLKCKINTIEVEAATPVLFQPMPCWNGDQTGTRIQESVIKLQRGVNQRVKITVINSSDRDFVFDSGEVLGTLEELECVMPVDVQFQEFVDQSTKATAGVEDVTAVGVSVVDADDGKTRSRLDEATTSANDGGRNQARTFSEVSAGEVAEEDQGFLQLLSEMVFPELDEAETDEAKLMLWQEREAFGRHPDDIGCVPELTLDLLTTDEIPVQRRYNSIPRPLYADVKKHIQLLLDKKWIEKSKSPWSSPVVCAAKKGGGLRLCVDYRLLNKKTVPDRHPLPRIQESLDALQGSRYFTTLDQSRAYWQGFMAPESRSKTAFVTPWGLYQWVRIPFGLTNAVPVFQRFMESTLEDYRDEFCIPYLDDTIIHSRGIADQIKQIRMVLQTFQRKGLKLNLSKCHFFEREVSYLGRRVNEHGYKMDETTTQAVRDLAGRKYETVGDVRQLLGLLSYHRRHVQSFAELAKPLTDLLLNVQPIIKTAADGTTKKLIPSKTRIEWEEEHRQSLERLIGLVTNPPILAYPNYEREFFIHTDASKKGLGAILYQADEDGVNRVIAYASRSLKPSEKNYHSSKLEFLAMKWSVTEKFRPYLAYAQHFKVFTDNNPLLYVMGTGCKESNPTMQRWISELAEFRFSIHYRAGVINKDADCLSRLPLAIDEYQEQCKEKITMNMFEQMVASVQVKEDKDERATEDDPSGTSSDEYSPYLYAVEMAVLEKSGSMLENPQIDVKNDQRSDPYIAPIIEVMEEDKVLDRSELSETSKLLWKERKRLSIDADGVLRRKSGSVSQLVLPLKHRDLIYKALHNDLGHLGSERVLQLARNRVFWPRMQRDVEEYTQKKCRCLMQKKTRQPEVAPLVSIHSSTPMELIAFDFLKLEKSSGGYEYILLIVDHFTRYAQAFPTKNKYAKTAAKHIFSDFILKFGLPARVLHDQGREFDNRLFRELENYCGIVKSRTTPYHPMTNGNVERMNSTVLHMLRTLAESEKPRWHEHVDKLMHAYNSTKHSTTGYSPHFLLFGREPVLPLDLVLTAHARPKENVGKQYSKFVEEWESRMTEAYNIAKERCDKVKNYAEDVWKKRKIANELRPGDQVLVRNKRETGGPGKLRSCWEQNVFVVTKQHENGVVYEVENLSRRNDMRTLHRNMLLPCDMLEEPPTTVEQPSTTKQASRKATRTTRQHNLPEPCPPVDTSSDEDDYYPCPVAESRMDSAARTSSNDEEASSSDAPISIESEPPREQSDPVPTTTVNAGVEQEDNEVYEDAPISSSDIGETMQADDGEGPANEGVPVAVRRTLRSQGRRMKWNPAMGEKTVIVEEPSCQQTNNTGEVNAVRPHSSEEESRARRLLNYCSETVCDWLELLE